MGVSTTGSYDLFIALTNAGLDRVIRAVFLESTARYGLPWPQSAEVRLFGEDRRFEFRFEAPTASIRPLPLGFTDPNTRDMLGISLPFRDSAIMGITPIYHLNGVLQIFVPITATGTLNLDFAQGEVMLAPSSTDPDAEDGNRTSAQKLPEGISLLASVVLTSQLQNGSLGIGNELLDGSFLDIAASGGRCPVAAVDGTTPANTPVVRPPRLDRLICVDAEDRGTVLLIKAKASTRAVVTGTTSDPDLGPLGWIQDDDEIGAVLSNRLLMDELLPTTVLPALVGVNRAAIRETATVAVDLQIAGGDLNENERNAAIRAAEDAAITAAIAPFFVFPMLQIAPVPMTIPLPTINDMIAEGDQAEPAVLTGPNALLTRSSFRVFPGGGQASVIRAVLSLSFSAPDVYTAEVTVDVAFDASGGRLEVDAGVQSVDITLPGLPNGFGSFFLNIIADPILNFFVDVMGEPGATQAADGVIGSHFDAGGIGGELRDVMHVRDVVLDDLTLRGLLRLQQDFAGNARLRAPIVERACLEDEIGGESGVNAESVRLPLAEGALGVTLEADVVVPEDGVELTLLGQLSVSAASNLGLADLLRADRTWGASPVPFGSPVAIGFPATTNGRVHALGVRDAAGRHGRLMAWIDAAGRMNGHLVRYRRILPQVVIRERPAGPPIPASPPLIHGWDPQFRAMYVDPAQVPGGSLVRDEATPGGWSEAIELPRLVGGGGRTGASFAMGSVMVGVTERSRRVDGSLLAVPTMLAAPVGDVQWAVRDVSGSEHALSVGETVVDLGKVSGGTGFVSCTVNASTPYVCTLLGEDGASIDAEFIARVNHGRTPGGGVNVVEARHRLRVTGRAHQPFGFSQWLDEFERAMMIAATFGDEPDPVGPRIQPVEGLARPKDRVTRGTVKDIKGPDDDGPFGSRTQRAVRVFSADGGKDDFTPIPEHAAADPKKWILGRLRAAEKVLSAAGAPVAVRKALATAIMQAEKSLPTMDQMLERAKGRRSGRAGPDTPR